MKTDDIFKILKPYGTIVCFFRNRNLEVPYIPMLDKYLSLITEGCSVQIEGITFGCMKQTAKRSFLMRIAMTGDLVCFGPYCHRFFIPEDPLSSMKSIMINPDLAKKILQHTNMNLMSAAVLVNISRTYSFDWDI